MESATSKMTARIAEIENCVLGGFVLDDRGSWVSIADKKAQEDDFLAHLEAGRVLHNGQWMQFKSVMKSAPAVPGRTAPTVSKTEETTLHPAPAPRPPETVTLNDHRQGIVAVPEPAVEEETSQGLFAPETKIIELTPPIADREAAREDPESGYAMETGLFVVDHSYDAAAAGVAQQETRASLPAAPMQPMAAEKETKRVPVFAPRSIPTWEKEESEGKKRGYIIGGIIIGTIGIAAIVLIVLQIL